MENDYSNYLDTELTEALNYLETCKLTESVEIKMDLSQQRMPYTIAPQTLTMMK